MMNLDQQLTLRVSVTDRCQLACSYCRPPTGGCLTTVNHLSVSEIMTFVNALQASSSGLGKVRLTGGEPLLRKDLPDLIQALTQAGIPDIGLTTNAQTLAGMAARLKDVGLHRVNVSCDSLETETFNRLTQGHLDKTLSGIDAALAAGLKPLKMNMVVMRGDNDRELSSMLAFAVEKGIELRFLELMPVGLSAERFQQSFVSEKEILDRLADTYTVIPMPAVIGETSRRYNVQLPDGTQGTFGMIASHSKPFCGGCNRLRLTADGHLVACLASQDAIDVRPMLRSEVPVDQLASCIRWAFERKGQVPAFSEETNMRAIGG